LRAFGPPPLRSPETLDAGEARTLNRFFDAPPEGSRLWVVEGEDRAILGAAYAERAVDYFTQETHGHLSILAVAAEAEGHGIGSALLATVEQWATKQRHRFITLNVFATNQHASAVYEHAGYRPDTVRYIKELRPSPEALTPSSPRPRRYPLALLILVAVALVWSGLAPHDRGTWWLEIFPILIGAPILVTTYRRFPLTNLLYTLLAIHALILMLGGHYTYAKVPLGFWAQELFGFARNHYDRLGHFAQGFIPAILAREILLRTSPLRRGRWLFALVTAVCLAFSACYEFIEWWAALAGGESAEAFLGTQGDVWDTQWDMFFALIGAMTAQLTLTRVHDKALRKLLKPGAR